MKSWKCGLHPDFVVASHWRPSSRVRGVVARMQGFLKSWGMILVSEIGDKTFFIAAIMAMKNRRRTVRIASTR